MLRRNFLASAALMSGWRTFAASTERDPALDLRERIVAPIFPNRDFDITRYGAVAGGAKDATAAIRAAIEACSKAGGGRVVVPKGVFLTGAIHLKSRVNLHVSAGATLLFTRDMKGYTPIVWTRWEGTECMNYSPLIYAFEQTDIAITGTGTLDGNCGDDHLWPWKGRKRDANDTTPHQAADRDALVEMANRNVPVAERVFGPGHYLRPQFVQPYRCKNVLIEGITIVNSPMWELHPVLCSNVLVRDVHIDTHGPNNDGCNPESCDGVRITGCVFNTGDDCIAIKSGRNADGRRLNVPCQNILVDHCTMLDGHGGVTIGSEASGGVRNVYVRDCQMNSPHLWRALRLKTNSYRGGYIENVSMRRVDVGQFTYEAVEVDLYYEEGPGGPYPPRIENIEVADMVCDRGPRALTLRGTKESVIRNVRLANCRFANMAKDSVIENVEGLRASNCFINGKSFER